MIIRFTVHDNDFGELMDNFVNDFNSLLQLSMPSYSITIDEQIKELERLNRINKLLNPNITEKHSEEEREEICIFVRKEFSKYIGNVKKVIKEYLLKKFEVSILDSFTDKWENGEVYYWFQHSRVWLKQ